MTIEELKQALEVVFNRHAKAVDTRGIRNAPTDWHVGQALDIMIPVLAENAKLLKVVEAAAALQVINTVIESRLSDELEDIERDVNAQEDAENALRKALEELNNEHV